MEGEKPIKGSSGVLKMNKYDFLRRLVIDDDDLITLGTIDDCEQELNIYKQALNEACKFLDKATCSCPYDSINEKISNCNVYDCKDQLAECWKEYLLKKASV